MNIFIIDAYARACKTIGIEPPNLYLESHDYQALLDDIDVKGMAPYHLRDDPDSLIVRDVHIFCVDNIK